MTKDLAIAVKGSTNVTEGVDYVCTEKFMEETDKKFQAEWKRIMQ